MSSAVYIICYADDIRLLVADSEDDLDDFSSSSSKLKKNVISRFPHQNNIPDSLQGSTKMQNERIIVQFVPVEVKYHDHRLWWQQDVNH